MPRLVRPFWVAEQIETAIFDGVGPRLRWALTGRVVLRWKLHSGVKLNRLHPNTFWVPSEDQKDKIGPGSLVKLIFAHSDGWAERMWVVVDKVGERRMVGYLTNDPLSLPRLKAGSRVRFHREHIIDYDSDPYTRDGSPWRHTYAVCDGCRLTNKPDPIGGGSAD